LAGQGKQEQQGQLKPAQGKLSLKLAIGDEHALLTAGVKDFLAAEPKREAQNDTLKACTKFY